MRPTSRQHLTDERLIDTYFARVGDRSGSEAVQTACEHVEACEVCSRRVAELTASLENLRLEAVAEADAYFTSDRLAAQQDRVMRHLEGVEHPARVIPFPQTSPRARAIGIGHPLYRWVAAAAAAGLLLGVAGGRLLYQRGNPASTSAAVSPATSSVQVRATQPESGNEAGGRDIVLTGNASRDEAFLLELEAALTQQRIAELQALDALTPHVREAAARAK